MGNSKPFCRKIWVVKWWSVGGQTTGVEKAENENNSIGIILCADKDHLDVEIALQDINKPIGVAEYQLLLPKDELQKLIFKELNQASQDQG